jgi:hypothetical protein
LSALVNQLKATFWAPLKARKQEGLIREELAHYSNLVLNKYEQSEIDQFQDNSYVKTRLHKRLDAQNIGRLTKEKGSLNIVYLSPMDPWEQVNIPLELEKFGTISYLPETDLIKQINQTEAPSEKRLELRNSLNEFILDFVTRQHHQKPIDLVISYLSGRYLTPDSVQAINKLGIRTAAFWLDTDLKFKSTLEHSVYAGSASVAQHYHLNLTSDSSSIIKFFGEDALAIFWPEGANPSHFKPMNEEKKFDVTFIGAKYGLRGKYVNYLRKNGINVTCFGYGWKGGKLKGGDMIKIYAQSKINLGFGGIGYSMTTTHLKGRDFEVPMCGGVYVTTYDDDLDKLYTNGEHIFMHRSKEELLEIVRNLLEDDNKRTSISANVATYCRENHTWEKRFDELIEMFR